MATATVLGVTGLAVPAYATDDAPKTEGTPKFEFKNGTLEWGVLDFFRKYVNGKDAQGKIEVADGAKQDGGPKGPFAFVGGEGSYDPAKNDLSAKFKGSVRFLGHQKDGKWKLDIKLADLRVTSDAGSGGTKGSLLANVTTQGESQGEVRLAELDLGAKPEPDKNGVVTYAKISAKVAEGGEKAFSRDGHPSTGFEKGDPLDPVALSGVLAKSAGLPENNPATGGQAGGASGGASGGSSGGSSGSSSGSSGGASGGASAGASGGATGGNSGSQQTDGRLFGGNVDWGVLKFFRSYINGRIAKGKAELSDGAVKSGDGYRFTQGEGTFDTTGTTPTLKADFKGQVRFTGHNGQLDITLSHIGIVASGKTGTLYADVANKTGKGGKPTEAKHVEFATLQLAGDALKAKDGVVSLSSVPATLTDKGEEAFERNDSPSPGFEKGSSLDPVTVAVAVKEGAKLPEPPAGTGFANCAEATAAGKAPLHKGEDGYSAQLDTDGDGVACETSAGAATGGGGTTGGTANTTGGAATTGGTGTSTGDTTSLASTGANTPTGPLLGAAGALVLAGSGAVFATRRRGRTTA
ncbi:HtaA domain-containing protein [Streptomyces sp. VNUA116]|uniref:HtaA domain-containing protein n=1 Tax=Streptomyces sp. VNUA116 TaxID=3062449 RepID=UPI0026768FA8|nr:HtaA domain-containing protein [Streptomyces sp. VNUA116]WKU44599.1 HtaA domain-containing protein [Streptomyces sp. VNUA116]